MFSWQFWIKLIWDFFLYNMKFLLESNSSSKRLNKFSIVVSCIFIVSCSYVAFFVDNPSQDSDLLFYYFVGKQILSGDGTNVQIVNGPVGWPILLATFNSFINDPFISGKLFSLIFSTGIVILSYLITRNIFNQKIAFLAQIIVATHPLLHLEAIITHSEMLPVFLIFASIYFITKKELLQRHIILCGIFLGLSFMIRPQSLLVGIGILIFLLTSLKKQKKRFIFFISITFFIVISPLIIYNIVTTGNIIDINPDFYLINDSNVSDNEYLKNEFIKDEPTQNNFNILTKFKEYFTDYPKKLLNYNSHLLFNLGSGYNNSSPIPFVPFNGIFLILGGILGLSVMSFSKKRFLTIIGISAAIIVYLLMTETIGIYFFLPIILPVIIIVGLSYRKIPSNAKPLLTIPLFFLLAISIVKIAGGYDIFAIVIVSCVFSSFFIISTIPKIMEYFSNKLKRSFYPITTTVVMSIIILIISVNLVTSYMIQEHVLYGIPVDYHNLFDKNKEYNLNALKYKEIGQVLSKEYEIENKIIMSNSNNYAFYANSKFIHTTFREDDNIDSISSFLNRQNWSDYDLKISNISSIPQDRYGIRNPVPDYLVYEINESNNKILHALGEPNSSRIPLNLELLYISNDQSVLIYKINYDKIN